jgi:hypothetical protein
MAFQAPGSSLNLNADFLPLPPRIPAIFPAPDANFRPFPGIDANFRNCPDAGSGSPTIFQGRCRSPAVFPEQPRANFRIFSRSGSDIRKCLGLEVTDFRMARPLDMPNDLLVAFFPILGYNDRCEGQPDFS